MKQNFNIEQQNFWQRQDAVFRVEKHEIDNDRTLSEGWDD